MTIDPLSIFFWVAALYTFWLALERSPNFSWWWPATRSAYRPWFSLQIYQRTRADLDPARARARAAHCAMNFGARIFTRSSFVFALCTIPPIVWNSQHAWITHRASQIARRSRRSRRAFIRSSCFRFSANILPTYSPLLFLGLAWAVIASWRRAQQNFKVLFLLWFGLPVFLLYSLLSVNKAAAPNWDGLAFLSLGLLAISYWRERSASRERRGTGSTRRLPLGLLMSAVLDRTSGRPSRFGSYASVIRAIACAAGERSPRR